MRFKVPEGLKYFANRKQLHSTFKSTSYTENEKSMLALKTLLIYHH
jgi:hypothetical protein